MRTLLFVFFLSICVSCLNTTETQESKASSGEGGLEEGKVIVSKEYDELYNRDEREKSEDTESFEYFLSLFENKFKKYQYEDIVSKHSISKDHLNKLPTERALKYLKIDYQEGFYIGIFSDSVVRKEDYIFLYYTLYCVGGGECISSHVASFSADGKMISELVYSATYEDLHDLESYSSIFLNDTIIVEHSKVKRDDNYTIIQEDVKKSIFVINEGQFIKMN